MNGVVVMAYGTPATPDDIEAYYTHIRGGRPPTDAQLADLRSRYEAIGGSSPLRAITELQTARIATALGDDYRVALGMKHAPPFIEDAVDELAGAGVSRITGVVLAPHDSRGSIGEYASRLADAGAMHGVKAGMVRSWHDLPEWQAFEAAATRDAIAELPSKPCVVFTAHSLPERVLADDLYPDQLAASADAIATRAELEYTDWRVAWQSAARTPEPWRGPDILDEIDAIADDGRFTSVVVCAQGFTSDHLEILYDLDIAARARAESRGLAFARTRSVNDDESVLIALAERVRAAGA